MWLKNIAKDEMVKLSHSIVIRMTLVLTRMNDSVQRCIDWQQELDICL